ncbi:MAG: hypothetical protein A2033_10265 [Bacteroidetes bacterium GWA2_31_9]|nr:MAG: hypothetical protein A2033_10265 [Bacteroidetes bacterium GWA2_31_9]
MNDIQFLLFSLVSTVVGWLFIAVLPSDKKSVVNSLFVFINALLLSIPAIHVINGNEINYIFRNVGFFGDIPLRIDALSAWFILIINFTSLTGAIYGIGYMKQYSVQTKNLTLHWIEYLLFQISMVWVCIVQNSLVFLVIWEVMSLSSLLLVIFEHQNIKTLKAGLNYLVQMHIGVAFITVAFLWVYIAQGTMDFVAIKDFFAVNSNIWLFLLFFIGFGIKAGFIPLHSWLPHAHPAAPSHVSGVMSGVIVKVGIYGIFRVVTYLQSDFVILGESMLVLSLFTGLFGIINSAMHRDFKKMLAYCTVENIGIIGSGIGLGLIGIGTDSNVLTVLGFSSALLHVLNHSLFKSLLFFSAGSVYQQTHTRDMEQLGGLIKKMPQTALIFLFGAIAIGGLPPFNGFVSEFILYSGFFKGLWSQDLYLTFLMIFAIGSLAFIGGISIFTFTKSFGVIFLGSPRNQLHIEPVEVPFHMRLPQYIIIAVMLSIGIFPVFYITKVMAIISTTFPAVNLSFLNYDFSIFTAISSIGIYALLFIIVIIAILIVRKVVENKKVAVSSATWGCGYVAPNVAMQYTGKSFSKTLGKLLSFIVFEKKKYNELKPNEIFPEARRHSALYTDFVEFRIIDKTLNRLLYFMDLFQFIQNGSLQRYILYGLIFIILIFFGTYLSII